MPHLPIEIWLLIASYCDPKDLWLSIRPINRQLQQCAEQYVKQEVLPHTILVLPVVIPTYDLRVPIRGRVVFKPLDPSPGLDFNGTIFCLDDTEPDYYRPHFLTRWATMQDRDTGRLDARRIRWELELEGQRSPVSLHCSTAIKHGCKVGEARVSFDWRYMLTTYFQA